MELEETVFEPHVSIDANVHQVGAAAVNYGNPGQLRPRFYWKACKNNFQSELQGKPIFDKKAYIDIPFPGTRDRFDGPVTPHFQKVFPKQWANFLASAADVPDGIPLKECPLFDVTEIETLNYYRVYTVEQTAALSDNAIMGLPGGLGMRTRAQRYLDNANGLAASGELAAEKKQLEDTVRAQSEMLKQMQQQLQALAAKSDDSKPAAVEPAVDDQPKDAGKKKHEK